MFATLSGGQKFSKLDLSQAYQQILVDEKSKLYLTINTHQGLFQVNRLPFGVSSAPSIFQKCMDQILQAKKSTMSYLDDTLVTGKDDPDHLANLDETLTKMEENGFRLKQSKCSFFQDKLEYLGHVISAKGLEPAPSKISAIQNAPNPSNITQLRAFLGMVNYYGKFLPGLSTLLKPLHELLEKNSAWEWGKRQESAITEVKKLLVSGRVLVHFNPESPLILSCDASSYGVGAVLGHIDKDGVEHPIAFASRTLSAAERAYAQIEKEALSLIFGIKKFHQYLYGQKFTLVTDHLPLVRIFGPKTGIPTMAAARLQRWALLLSAHTYDIQYRHSQAHGNADGLSRIPLPVEESEDDNAVELFNLEQMRVLPVTHKEIAQHTKKDKLLATVLKQVSFGWTELKDPALKPFWIRKEEITIQSDCLLWGIRVIVPETLQSVVLKEIHACHVGIVRMKAIARGYVWWPGLDAAIEQTVAHCVECQQVRNAPAKAPLHPWSFPDKPWQRLHIDFAGPFLEKNFLVVVDAHSKWPEVLMIPNITASKTIEYLRSLFAKFGISEQIVSDNGSAFISEEFKTFMKLNGIKHILSAPYHPASNGQAERFVQTFKKAIKRQVDDRSLQQKLDDYLLTYRNTPHATTGESPAKLLMKRTLRTRLDLLRPCIDAKVRENQTRQILSRPPNEEKDISSGDQVIVRKYGSKQKWIPGIVEDRTGPVSYRVQISPNEVVRRHQDQILRSASLEPSSADASQSFHNQEVPRVNLNQEVVVVLPQEEVKPNVAGLTECERTPTRRSMRHRQAPKRWGFEEQS